MLYLVRMDVAIPDSLPQEELHDLQEQEKQYSQRLQKEGRFLHLWRIAGAYANYSVFDVADHDELHDVLQGLPLFRYITTEITPLAHHPNALHHS